MFKIWTYSQQKFQRRFNVVFRLIWRRDVVQRQINVETALCMSNVEQGWNNVVFFNTELNNVRQRRNNFVIFNVNFHDLGQRRNNVENVTIWKKIYKPRFKNKIIFLNFKEYVGLNIFLRFFPILTLSWRRPLSYRNQSIDLPSKSMDWFLYDNDLRHERVKINLKKSICRASKNLKTSNILNNKKYI